jgi:peroxiredoxin
MGDLHLSSSPDNEIPIRRIPMKINDRIDDFASIDQNGREVRLSELLTEGPLVLFFYPKAMTPG